MAIEFQESIESVGKVIDGAGVAVIVLGAAFATGAYLWRQAKRAPDESGEAAFRGYRRRLGRAILLGLEFLVAADIIRTVAVAPELPGSRGVAGIVAIRTFLSFTLELEINGRWPWQQRGSAGEGTP